MTIMEFNPEPRYYLSLTGEPIRAGLNTFRIVLGPWKSKQAAVGYSDNLTDTRIGEQLLMKLGIEELLVFESA